MTRTRQSVALALAAGTAALSLALSMTPADALSTIPSWPSTGRVPLGCDAPISFVVKDSAHWNYVYTDRNLPTVTSVNFGSGTSPVTAVPPAGRVVGFTASATETCGGIQILGPLLSHDGQLIPSSAAGPVNSDPFHASFSGGQVMAPDSAGVYRIVAIVVLRRYDTLTLNQDFLYVSSTVPSASTVIAGPSPQKNYFVLRQTTLATSQSATKVKKGKTVKVTGLLKYATNAGYVPDNGERVLAQTRIGTGKWVTRATLTTTSTGAVAYYLAPLRTTRVRFVHANVYSGRYTAAAISATRTVTVG